MRPTTLLTTLIYALLLVGLATLQGHILLLAIPPLLYLGMGVWRTPAPAELVIERVAPTAAVREGEEVSLTLTIRNEGQQTAELLAAEQLPVGLTPHTGHTQLLTSLAPQQTAELTYTLIAQRGTFDVAGTAVTLADPFHLFTWHGAPPVTTHLTVIPRYEPLRSLPMRPTRTMGFSGPLPAGQSGTGANFWGVRQYQLGDPLRHVNWRASARHHEQLYSTEFEQERVANISLVLDTRQEYMLRGPQAHLLDNTVRATAALADSLLQDGHRVGLVLYGYGLDGVLPGYGKKQRERILRKLASARPGNQLFRTLHYLPIRLFPAGAQLVFISPLAEGDEAMLFRLRARGYGVMVVCPNVIDFEARYLATADHPLKPLALRVATLERQGLLRRLRQAGIITVDWAVHQPLDELLQRTLRTR